MLPREVRVAALRLLATLTKSRRDAELDAEIKTHLELLAEEQVRCGLSPDEARLACRRACGGVEQMKELQRDQRELPLSMRSVRTCAMVTFAS